MNYKQTQTKQASINKREKENTTINMHWHTKLHTLNSIYEARFASHWASIISKAIQ